MSNEFAKKGYNSALEKLHTALEKRGYTQPTDPKLGDFEMLRTLTEWTGAVYPAQTETIKKNAVLIGEGKVIITMDTNTKQIHFLYGDDTKAVERRSLLNDVVRQTLGAGWITVIGSSSPKPESKKKVKRGRKAKR